VSACVEVRRCTQEEWEQLRELRLRALDEAPDSFGSTYEREARFDEAAWRERTANCAIARCDGITAGLVGGIAADGGAVELVAMWVEPEFRGRGVGDRLVDWVAATARAIGAGRVALWVADGNVAARRMYERCGFVDVDDDTPVARRAPRADHRMELPLADG
jgi:GNAT superfamily N-acetyltransferase